jgi:GNAT superfamily N-acetyltransferase
VPVLRRCELGSHSLRQTLPGEHAGADPAVDYLFDGEPRVLPEPWVVVPTPEIRAALERQLRVEVAEGHLLFGKAITAVARCSMCDEVPFSVDEDPASFVEVHLTWRQASETPPWPWAERLSMPLADSLTDHRHLPSRLGGMTGRRRLPDGVGLGIAGPDDVPELLALWAIAAENDSRPSDTAEAVLALLERDSGACIVARQGDRIVGTLIAGWDGWRAHLYRLAVHPDMRRRGVAQALLDAGAARLRSLGATRLDAMVLEGNGLGQALWQSSGYTRQTEWRRWIKPVADEPTPLARARFSGGVALWVLL